jgi:hypothetical protein
MHDESECGGPELTADLSAFEQKLSRLVAAPLSVDRDRLMFEAGRAAERAGRNMPLASRPNAWRWPAATATMTAASLFLAAMLVWPNEPPPGGLAHFAESAEQNVPVPLHSRSASEIRRELAHFAESSEQSMPAPRHSVGSGRGSKFWAPRATSGYLHLRHIALTQGVGAMPLETLSANGHGTSAAELPQSRPATARNLLNELLPNHRSQTRS